MLSREEAILEGAEAWGAFYRANPHRFIKDYLHIDLHLFQKILIMMMNWSDTFVFIAARGLGKTFLSALFCVVRCILYPGTKIVIASGTRGQANVVLQKIMLEIKPKSPELAAEINEKETHLNGADAIIVFKNSSFCKVVTASDTARSNRANIVLVDEFRMVNKTTIDTILRKFLSNPRIPDFLNLPEYKSRKREFLEENKTFYLSSAYFKDSWAFDRTVDKFKAMLKGAKSFMCALPYQLALENGLQTEAQIIDQMSESDFNEIAWNMEMDAIWFGDEEGSFFSFDAISKNRAIKYPMYPSSLFPKAEGTKVSIPKKSLGEIRILSADIALMSSTKHKNDASSIFINQMLQTKSGRYTSNIVYADVYEGLRTDEQALIIRKLYDEFQCDYIVLDTNGIGLGVYDELAHDIVDSESGEIYPALSCCNSPEMAERCTVKGADKVIWSIKASSTLNSDCAVLLREAFKSGKIRLLANEYDGENNLKEFKWFAGLDASERFKFTLPYIHTTLLINELVNLQHEENAGKIRLHEKSGMRKDRYSSLSYNYYVACQIEAKQRKRENITRFDDSEFIFRAPKIK